MNMSIKIIHVGLIIMCLGMVNSASPCDTNIYLEVGKQGTVNCSFQDFLILGWINGDGSYGESTPFIYMENSVKKGRGYDSGEYDILPNGSLIINNVQLKHEFNFTVSYTPNVGRRMAFFVPVSVYVHPSPEYPVVNGLTNQQYIYQEVDFYSGSINCTMNGVRPGVDLEWVYQSDVISMENEPSSTVSNTDGTYNTSLSSRYTIRDRSVSKITLQCRVVGEMADLFPSVTTIYFLNLNTQFPIVNGEANQQHLVLQLNREDEVTCSLYRVLQGASLKWVILSPKDEAMLDSEISKIDNEDGTVNITLRSKFIEIGPSVRHVVLQCGVSGPEGDMYPDVTTVDVLFSEILLSPVIDGCYSQQEDCNLTMSRNGTMACSVLAVPLKYRMDISLDISADASGLSLARIKDHHHPHVNGDMYDLTTSYQYTVDEGSTESVIKCSLSGINNQPMDSRATARIIWQDTLYKQKTITGSTSDGGDSNRGLMFVSIALTSFVAFLIIIIIIIVKFKKELKPQTNSGIEMKARCDEGTQESGTLLEDQTPRTETDFETKFIHITNLLEKQSQRREKDFETKILHITDRLEEQTQRREEDFETILHITDLLEEQTQRREKDFEAKFLHITDLLEKQTPRKEGEIKDIVLQIMDLLKQQSQRRETDFETKLLNITNLLEEQSQRRENEPPLASSTPAKNVAANLNKTSDARDWMSKFFDRHGDYFPDDDIMVIPFQSKKAVHDLMVQERGSEVAKYGTASEQWKESFPKCIPLNKDTPTPNHTTITITTMKLSDINLPYFSSTDNLTGDTALPRVHLTGALFKVRSDESTHIFRNLNHISRDTNFVVHCLLNLLLRHRNQLDRTLLLQLHCQQSKINKQVLLSSVALLVDQQTFDKIIVRFLPEEPTIKAVETAFSVIDEKLCSEDIPHLDDLDRIIGNITKGQVEEIKYVFDIETWISSYLVKWSTNVNNEIWFRLDKIGENTVMHYKPNLEAEWTPSETVSQQSDSTLPRLGNGEVCFKETPDVTKSPDFVRPRLHSVIDLDAVEKTLRQNYHSEQSVQYLNKWKSLLDTIGKVPPPSLSWPLPKLKDEHLASRERESGTSLR